MEACKAQVARSCEKRERFQLEALKVIGTKEIKKMTWKSLQGRNMRLQANFDSEDRALSKMSDVVAEVTKMKEILELIKNERKMHLLQKVQSWIKRTDLRRRKIGYNLFFAPAQQRGRALTMELMIPLLSMRRRAR